MPGFFPARAESVPAFRTGQSRFAPACVRAPGLRASLRAGVLAGAALAVLGPGVALAGQIYGQITHNKRPIGDSGRIEIVCGSSERMTAQTDRNGRYELFMSERGRCSFTLTYRNRTVSASVSSDRRPSRHDFTITGPTNGPFQIRQR